jgi:5-formyltetrahydrofolate cyclo-ligase
LKSKSALRRHFLELLNKQGSEERTAKSREVAAKLFALPAFKTAKTVLFYASLPGEVETFAMMQQAMQLHKNVALPIIARDQRKLIPILTDSLEDLDTGPFGISAPQPDPAKFMDSTNLDMVIVPGLAFDRTNNRLGRGAGYYDRFLCDLPATTAKVGIAFDFQIVDCLPVEEHDVPLTCTIAA